MLGLPQRAFAPGGWDFHKGLSGTRELVASLDRGVSPLRVMGGHCRVSPQGCPQHLITQTHGKNLGPLSAVGTSRGRDRTCPHLVFPPCSLVPSLLPPCPHSFVLSPHPSPPLIGSHLGSSCPAALFLSLTLLCVLSDTFPHLPLPPMSLLLSLLPCPSPGLFSPQTFLASSGGLYCLGGGCGNVVIPGCMSLPSTPASSPPCGLHAQAWPWLCMGWTWQGFLP